MSNPYSNQFGQNAPPPPRNSTSNKTLIIILSVVAGLIIFCGGVAMVVSYIAANAIKTGVSAMGGLVFKETLSQVPEIEAELGKIQSVQLDFDKSSESSETTMTVVGTKGTGTVVMNQDTNESVLTLPDGRKIPFTMPELEEPNFKMPPPSGTDGSTEGGFSDGSFNIPDSTDGTSTSESETEPATSGSTTAP